MAYTDIQKVRIEVADLDPGLPLLADDEYAYLLEKNNNSVVRASVDAARIILLKLSQQTDETVSIFSVKGSKAAEQYRLRHKSHEKLKKQRHGKTEYYLVIWCNRR